MTRPWPWRTSPLLTDETVARADEPADDAVADSADSVEKARAAYLTAVGGRGPRSDIPGPPVDDEDDDRKIGAVERYRPQFTPDWISGGVRVHVGLRLRRRRADRRERRARQPPLLHRDRLLLEHRVQQLHTCSTSTWRSRANYSLGVYNFKEYYYSDRTRLGEDLGEKRYFTERSYGVSVGSRIRSAMFTRVRARRLGASRWTGSIAEENEEGDIELTDEKVEALARHPGLRFVNDTTLWGSVGSDRRRQVVARRLAASVGDRRRLRAF